MRQPSTTDRDEPGLERLSSTSGSTAIGLNSAFKRVQDRFKWHQLVKTAMSCQGRATWLW